MPFLLFFFFLCEKCFVFSINVFTSCAPSVHDMVGNTVCLEIRAKYTRYHRPRFLTFEVPFNFGVVFTADSENIRTSHFLHTF